MKTKSQKKEGLKTLKEKFSNSNIVIFTSFARENEKGLDVKAMADIKKNLRDLKSEYLVEKKTILDKAIKEINKNIDVFSFQGSLGTTFGYGDAQLTAKAIYNFARKYPALKYFGAIWMNKFLDSGQLSEFAKLPSKEVLLARLLGMLKYPLSALAISLDQIIKSKH